jgi:ParB-like chromosome segregation protein Spo0J
MTLQSMAKHVEHWLLARLKPNRRNPRLHSDAQIAALAGSILGFGFNSPILVDSGGSIIAGEGRYRAALKLELETVPVIVLDHLSETEKRAYLFADNKLAELSSFDDDLLREELAELRDDNIDLGALGFSDDELTVLLANADDGTDAGEGAEEEILETPAEPVTRPVDIWTISGHRLACGDCRDPDVVHRLFDGARQPLHHIAAIRYAARIRPRE